MHAVQCTVYSKQLPHNVFGNFEMASILSNDRERERERVREVRMKREAV